MKNKLPSQLKFMIFVVLITVGITLLVRHFHISDFYIVKPNVLYTSGQPRGMDYTRLLYKYHIAAIINLRQESEHRDENWHNEEVVWTRNNGVRYFEMPVDKNNSIPNGEIQAEFLSIMADKNNLPILLHGGSDDKRVALLTAVWLVKTQDYTIEQTSQVLSKMLDSRAMVESETRFLQTLKKQN